MLIFLYGPDSYRRRQKLKEIIENYKSKHSLFSFDYFNLADAEEFNRLKDFVGQQIIFEDKKAAIVDNPFSIGSDILKEFSGFLKNNIKNEKIILIISDDNGPPESLEFILKEASNKQEFINLEGGKMSFFVKSEARKRKINFSDSAINALAESFKNNGWGLVNELDKIELFSKPGEKINFADLEKTIDFRQSVNVFNFINAVSRGGSSTEKLKSLEELFLSNEEPAMVFNILASRPFLNFETVKKMADYDVLIKSGRMDYETALLDLCLG